MVEISMQEAVEKAWQTVKQGGVMAYPTDTVWGLGCDATNAAAVDKLLSLKGREQGKGCIILIDDLAKLARYVKEVPEVAYDLMELSSEPLTVVFDQGVNVAAGVTAPDGSLAVRCVRDPFCAALIRKMNKPLVSTSANYSGKPPAHFYHQLDQDLLKHLDHVAEWRREDKRSMSPSRIIQLRDNGEIHILRK